MSGVKYFISVVNVSAAYFRRWSVVSQHARVPLIVPHQSPRRQVGRELARRGVHRCIGSCRAEPSFVTDSFDTDCVMSVGLAHCHHAAVSVPNEPLSVSVSLALFRGGLRVPL